MALRKAIEIARELNVGTLISQRNLQIILDLFGPQANQRNIVAGLNRILSSHQIGSLLGDLPDLKSQRGQLARIRSAARTLQIMLNKQGLYMKIRLLAPTGVTLSFGPAQPLSQHPFRPTVEAFERGLEAIGFSTNMALESTDHLKFYRMEHDREAKGRPRNLERRLLWEPIISLWDQEVGRRPPATNHAISDSPIFKILSIINSELKLEAPKPGSVYLALREFKATAERMQRQRIDGQKMSHS
jgi:hypothetical protein